MEDKVVEAGKEVAKEFKDELLQRLDVLSSELGTTATHVYEVLVRQQSIEAIQHVTRFGASLIVALLLIKGAIMSYTKLKEIQKERGNDAIHIPLTIILGIGAMLCSLLTLIQFLDLSLIIGKLMNPEYYALQEIMKLF